VGDDAHALRAALEQLTWQQPTPAETAAAARGLDRQRHRRRWLVGGAVAAVIVALAASIAIPLRHAAPPAYQRTAGEWTYGLALDRPGWTVTSHRLTATEETIELAQSGSEATCRVSAELHAPTPADRATNPFRRVRVNGRLGAYATTGGLQRLSWPIGPTATATASCSGTVDDRGAALQTARTLRMEQAALRLPFRLTEIPPSSRLGWVGEQDGRSRVSIVHATGLNVDAEAASISVYQVSYGSGLDHEPDRDWHFTDQGGGLSACRTVDHLQFCINDPSGGSDGVSTRSTPNYTVLLRTIDEVGIVPGAADPSRWLDANQALPR
jgi:hypothetical protein